MAKKRRMAKWPQGSTISIFYKRILVEEFMVYKKNIAAQISNLMAKCEEYTPNFT